MTSVLHVARDIQQAKGFIRNTHIDLICADNTCTDSNFLENIQKLKFHRPNIKFLLVTKENHTQILKYLSYGLDEYILKENLNEHELLCRVSKLLCCYEYPTLTILSYKGIYLNRYLQQLYFKKIRISLSEKETYLFEYLIINNGFVNNKDLIKYISVQSNSSYNMKCLGMLVCRVKTKIYLQTGFTLIRSKYSIGYYINL